MIRKLYSFAKEQKIRRKNDITGRLARKSLKIGNNTRVALSSLDFTGESRIHIGESCNLLGRFVCRLDDTTIEIGSRCFIATGTTVLASKYISIGSDVLIGENCYITDNDGHAIDPALRSQDVLNSFHGVKNWKHIQMAPVVIGDNVWIAPRCIILKGVNIGRGSVIAAGSVVTRDIPEMTLAGGNPARVIKSIINQPQNRDITT